MSYGVSIEQNDVITSYVFGHLHGITAAIFLMSTDPSNPLARVLWLLCRRVDGRWTSIANSTF